MIPKSVHGDPARRSEFGIKTPIGTGPYRMVEHKRQQFIVYEAIPNHHVETAGFKTVTLRRVTDQSARLAMLRSGEIDITEIAFKLKREAEAAGLKLMRVPGAAVC
jgi:peptide/nickel transport system substrate-binding protein